MLPLVFLRLITETGSAQTAESPTQSQQPNLTRHVCNPLTLTGIDTQIGARRTCSLLIKVARSPFRKIQQCTWCNTGNNIETFK